MQADNTEYNDIPVFYCRRCLSLRILTDSEFGDYCGQCGSTNIGQIHIEEWETLQKEQTKLKEELWQRKRKKR